MTFSTLFSSFPTREAAMGAFLGSLLGGLHIGFSTKNICATAANALAKHVVFDQVGYNMAYQSCINTIMAELMTECLTFGIVGVTTSVAVTLLHRHPAFRQRL